MGNRAVITTSTKDNEGIGIYLHWNGSPETVRGFLDEARRLKYRDPINDEQYAMARLCGLICASIDGSTGVGIGCLAELDTNNGDNGVYIIGKDWEIVQHLPDGFQGE